jgi:hypothetical protein
MKTLLRSVFIGSAATDSETSFTENYHRLVTSGLAFDTTEDNSIWEAIKEFHQTHGHLPNLGTLRAIFEADQKPELVSRLETVAISASKVRGDFVVHLQTLDEERKKKRALDLLDETKRILTSGVEVREGKEKRRLFGSADAVHYFWEKSSGLTVPTLGTKSSGNVTTDGQDFLEHYERIKSDPTIGLGFPCGLAQADEITGGIRKKQLWIHAAFAGGLKTYFAIHWAYVQAIYYGNSSVYFDLEVGYEDLRTTLYTIHSAHEDFAEVRRSLGIPGLGLSFKNIDEGRLTPNEEKFLYEYVVPDFNRKPTVDHAAMGSIPAESYGDIHIEGIGEKGDLKVADIRAKAELIHSKNPISMIFVDHVLLVSPQKWVPSTTERLNEVIRELKKLAMTFFRNLGIPIVGLFQISREGYKAAEKNGGSYNLTHLSYANECVARGTLIPTKKGLVPIEKIEVGEEVWSSSGWKTVTNFFDQGAKETFRITSTTGADLFATRNHLLRVLEQEQLVWRRVDQLREGDFLVCGLPTFPWSDRAPVSLPAGGPSRVMTDDLAYFFGMWTGLGLITRQAGKDPAVHFMPPPKASMYPVIQDRFQRVFGVPLEANYRPGRPKPRLYIHSDSIRSWLEAVGVARDPLEVPAFILQGTRGHAVEYLRGLTDTRAYFDAKSTLFWKGLRNPEVFQRLLSMLGLQSALLFMQDGRNSVRIQGTRSRTKYIEEIGFASLEDQRFSERIPRTFSGTDLPLPFAAGFRELFERHLRGHISEGHIFTEYKRAQKRTTVGTHALLALLDYLDQHKIEDPTKERLRAMSSLHFPRVKEIVGAGVRMVYDLEVTGDHEYQTGPFLSHNCERSADIVTAAWVDDDLRKMQKIIFQNLKRRKGPMFDRFPARIEFEVRRLLTDRTSMEALDQQRGMGQEEDEPAWAKKKGPPKAKKKFLEAPIGETIDLGE